MNMMYTADAPSSHRSHKLLVAPNRGKEWLSLGLCPYPQPSCPCKPHFMLCGIVRCSMAFASVQVERCGFSLLAPVLLVMSQLPVSLSAALSRRVCYLSCPWCEAAMCAGVLAELDMRVT